MTSYIYLVIVIKLCKFCLYDSDEQLREREREPKNIMGQK